MKTITYNLLDILENHGRHAALDATAVFSCSRNRELERFVRENSVNFAEQGLSITHLVYADEEGEAPDLVGIFTLANKVFRVSGEVLSTTARRKVAKFAEYDPEAGVYTLSAPLIAQFGKNDRVGSLQGFDGHALMDVALRELCQPMRVLGGRAVYLECEDAPGLTRFYGREGFFDAGTRASRRRDGAARRDFRVMARFLNPARV